MKKFSRVFAILSLYGLILFLDACVTTNCNCPEIQFEFQDYAGFNVGFLTTEIDSLSSRTLEIELVADSVHLIAQNCKTNYSLGLISKAYGCSCLPDGFRGDKFPIVAIDVYANRPFKSDYQTRTNLNHIFEVMARNNFGDIDFQIINDVNEFPNVLDFSERLSLRTMAVPDSTGLDHPYTFEIVITRNDGSIKTVVTEEVRWL